MKNQLKVKPLIEKHLLKDDKGTGKLNLYRRTNNLGETEYIYQETPDSEEILLTPTNKRFSDDPTNWDYKDASGREYTPRMTREIDQGTISKYEPGWFDRIKEATGYKLLVDKSNEYYNNPILGAAARWAASYDNNTNPIKGLWNSPLAYGNIYSMAAKAADELLLNPNGLQKTIDLYNNSDGSYADRYAWQSSLLGDVFNTSITLPAASKAAKPMWNAGKTALANQAEIQQGMKGLSTSEKLGWLWNKGKLVQRKIPINKEHFYRAVRTEDALNDAIENGVIRQGRHKPPMITFKGPFFGPGYISHERYGNYVFEGNPEHIQWIKPWPYHNNGEVIPWHPGVGSAFPYYEGSTTVPTTGFSYWKKYPFIGWRSRSFDSLPKKPTKALGGNLVKFKKGSKIHIKKVNRGKFTDYCGGEVTNECILRGKHSSNPAVRKRATFAANARKWKHLKGGIVKADDGIKFTINDGLALGSLLIGNIANSIQQNKFIDSLIKANKALNKYLQSQIWNDSLSKAREDYYTKQFRTNLKEPNSGVSINDSPTVAEHSIWDMASKDANNLISNLNNETQLDNLQLQQQKKSILGSSLGIAGNFITNKFNNYDFG